MSFEINGPTRGPEDQYIYEVTDKGDDTNRLSVARVLSGSRNRAEALVSRANAYTEMVETLREIKKRAHHGVAQPSTLHDIETIAGQLLDKIGE